MIEKLMTEQTKEEFAAMMIDFAAKKHLTIQNVVEATGEVVTYMTKNAVMQEEDLQGTPVNPQTSTSEKSTGTCRRQ